MCVFVCVCVCVCVCAFSAASYTRAMFSLWRKEKVGNIQKDMREGVYCISVPVSLLSGQSLLVEVYRASL